MCASTWVFRPYFGLGIDVGELGVAVGVALPALDRLGVGLQAAVLLPQQRRHGRRRHLVAQPCGRGQNKTPPVNDVVLQPLLAAAGYLADTLGPHAVGVAQQVKDADRKWSRKSGDPVPTARLPTAEFAQLLGRYERDGEPLPLLADHHIRDRLARRATVARCDSTRPGTRPR